MAKTTVGVIEGSSTGLGDEIKNASRDNAKGVGDSVKSRDAADKNKAIRKSLKRKASKAKEPGVPAEGTVGK